MDIFLILYYFDPIHITKQVNDHLRRLCNENSFYYVDNSLITTDYLWRDGLHLSDSGSKILSDNISDCLNSILRRNKVNND